MNTQITEEELLTNFVTNNPKLAQLEKLITEFNPFSVLGIVHHEIRHSNVLAWLLNPFENHGFGDIVLRNFVIEAIKKKTSDEFPYSIATFLSCPFTGIKIHREYKAKSRRIDILVECFKPRFIMIIENKIRSGESRNQLKDYLEFVKNKFPNIPVLPIYLSQPGDEPSEADYTGLTHEDVYVLLKDALDIHKDDLNPKKQEFINYYLKSLEEEVMDNPNIREYAQAIYREHSKAIELILKYRETTNSFEQAAKKFIAQHNEFENADIRNYWLWFIPQYFKPSVRVEMESWIASYPIACWFRKIRDEKLGLVLEVGPMQNKEKRIKLMQEMKQNKILRVPKAAFLADSRFTRVFSKYSEFEDWDNEELILEKMDHLFFTEAKNATKAVGEVVNEFDWNK